MNTYIALLRGINVSGQKIIKMAELKKMFENLGFQNVRTYIQSGNLVFETNETVIPKLEKSIRKAIENTFGFDVHIQILIPDEIHKALEMNPFLRDNSLDIKQHYFVFLNEIPYEENWNILKNMELKGEQMALADKILFVYYANGAGKSKLTTNLIESKLKVAATARNLNTSKKILEIASD